MKKLIFGLVALTLLLAACSQAKLADIPVEQRMQMADDKFADENYKRAAEIYKTIVFERHSRLTPKAQYRLAECHFLRDEFADARFEYAELIRLFPDFESIEDAYYKTGICYVEDSLNPAYTQEETAKAIDAFEIYLELYPNGQYRDKAIELLVEMRKKLLTKTYFNGLTYWRMDDYSAALMYFNEIIALGNTDELDCDALYYSFRIWNERGNQEKANQLLEKLLARYPNSERSEDARERFTVQFGQN